jgi:putative acetyltransferase
MIRKATIKDQDFLYELYMHPSINPYLLYEPMDAVTFSPILEELVQKNLIHIYYKEDNTAIGMFKLVPHTYRSAHIVYLGGVAIHPLFAGKGFGQQMMKAIIEYAMSIGFLRIELSVAVTNKNAINVYEKVGFVKEGIMKKYTYLKKADIFIDEVLMSFVK